MKTINNLKDLLYLKDGVIYRYKQKHFYFVLIEQTQDIYCYSYNTRIGIINLLMHEYFYTLEKFSRTTSKQMTQLRNELEKTFSLDYFGVNNMQDKKVIKRKYNF